MEIPIYINNIIINLSSIKKIQNFLFSKEHDYKKNENLEKQNILVKYENATFGVNISSENEKKIKFGRKKTNDSGRPSFVGTINKEILLHDINLTIKKGEFIAILGPKKSGKSSILNSILNNYKVISSDYPIIINGTLSYFPQENFIMDDTIKNNIISFNKFDEEKYSKIITVCELMKDFDNFQNRDDNIINSSNKNLSLGEKKRICLARCLYKDADMYLLDDPISNIDTEVSNNIFKNAFINYLKGKCRILVTNDMTNLNQVDKIILMEKGFIQFIGNYNEFIKKYGKDFIIPKEDFDDDTLGVRKTSSRKIVEKDRLNYSQYNFDQNSKFISETQSEFSIKTKDTKKEKNPLMISDDKYKKKKISFKIINSFIQLQGGYIIFSLLILFMIIARFIYSYRSIYISKWAKNKSEIEKVEKKEHINQKSFYISYFQITLLGIFLNFLIEYIHCEITLNSQKKLHELIVYKFLRAPIS